MKPIGHPLRAPCPLFLRAAAVQHFFVTLAALAVLAGCAGSGTVSKSSAPLVIADETLPLPIEGERLDMRAIKRVTLLAKSESLLVARHERNQLLFADIDASTLAAIDSQLAWFSGDVTLAEQLLEKLARDNTAALDFVLSEQEQRSALAGDWLAAAKHLFHLSRRGNAGRKGDAVSDQLFAYLLRLDSVMLQEQLTNAENPDWRRWLEMQVAYRQGLEAFSAWQQQTNALPQSPAIPRHLTQWTKPRDLDRITLLLPLEGTLAAAGEAVLSGAMAQLYTLFPDPRSRPALSAMDSTRADDVSTAYRQATEDGADLVIGPLTKTEVTRLRQLAQRPVPVIALNQSDDQPARPAQDWLSLSLAPEDEARQIADIAFGRACRNAIVIAADSHRGLRLLTAFEQRWTNRGGKLRGRLLVDDPAETNEAMGKLLGSGSSDQRIRSIERAFDLPVDARGRGRTDFECIFMLAPDPATARTWRPLLVFHMTGDVPVYATSAINDGEDDTRNRDLNGVMFVETPAMLPPHTSSRLTRLRALGQDAITLALHWEQAAATDDWIIQGETGLLRRRENGSVERALKLATFDGSQIRSGPLR